LSHALQMLFLLADLLFGKALAPVDIPGIEHEANSPAQDWEDRPEEAVQVGHRPDDYDESVDQAVDEQVRAEVAALLQPLDRLIPQGGTLGHIVESHDPTSSVLTVGAALREA